MTIFIAADHRGFELKNKLIEYLQEKNIRVQDLGAYNLDPEDDYPDYGKKLAQAVLQNPEEFLGVAICGSGIGMSIATNRFKGIRCGLCLSVEQAQHGRKNDHINVVGLASDYTNFEQAIAIVDAFLNTPMKKETKYLRRSKQMDEFESPR